MTITLVLPDARHGPCDLVILVLLREFVFAVDIGQMVVPVGDSVDLHIKRRLGHFKSRMSTEHAAIGFR